MRLLDFSFGSDEEERRMLDAPTGQAGAPERHLLSELVWLMAVGLAGIGAFVLMLVVATGIADWVFPR